MSFDKVLLGADFTYTWLHLSFGYRLYIVGQQSCPTLLDNKVPLLFEAELFFWFRKRKNNNLCLPIGWKTNVTPIPLSSYNIKN